ncbi:similar to Saccharomyces cerevisiae YOR278W HEM4 Uroporphyrinogen III synthase [Maudiozyma saulgeensis]|uniref:Similar to Saccharomyces cerevisiae YOR278W HEM4 Uroporphyrinogen III synthase n=1 Tax=Maudiozyma saulgeensis TaxID=1789683 RepID=A0A1X7R531_9SACH|nr:similar to Saccharomyces cerevisiae YOR278W HEM4 Uroporphyrinogen III synthase [Kazachstania saulgeensis]
MSNNIIFLKNRTTPLDKYEVESKDNQYSDVQFLPLIAHTHHPMEALLLLKNNDYLSSLRYLIVTSQRTVECLRESIIPTLTNEQKEKLFGLSVYTVGPATGDFLRRVGFHNVKGDDMGNGDKLSDFIIEDIGDDYNGEILSLVGAIRRDIIKNKLKQVGLSVKEVVTYETSVLNDNLDRFQNTLIDIADKEECDSKSCCWVVIFSPQGAKDIIKFLKQNPSIKNKLDLKISCIGPTTNNYLLDNGINPEVVSPEPTPDSLLGAIDGFQKSMTTAVQH